MNEQIQVILDSYHNGQKEQMVDQIKAYGQAKFFVEFYRDMRDYFYNDASPLYATIVYTFFLLK